MYGVCCENIISGPGGEVGYLCFDCSQKQVPDVVKPVDCSPKQVPSVAEPVAESVVDSVDKQSSEGVIEPAPETVV